jgi:hypothetical protein
MHARLNVFWQFALCQVFSGDLGVGCPVRIIYALFGASYGLFFCAQFKDKHSEMMTFEGHCKQIQSLETETTDRYTTVCEKCELPYKDCDCHCPICCLPLTACHVDCRVDDEMPQDQPQAVTVIHPKTAQLPSVHETPRTLGTLGFSPVDVIDVEKKRAFFLTKVLEKKSPLKTRRTILCIACHCGPH